MFTARYAPSLYIKRTRLVFKGLISNVQCSFKMLTLGNTKNSGHKIQHHGRYCCDNADTFLVKVQSFCSSVIRDLSPKSVAM